MHTACLRRTLLALGLVAIAASSARSAPNAAPRVTLAQRGADEILGQLKFLLDLTAPKEKALWKDLKEYLDVFLIEVDHTKPMRTDAIFADGPLRYRMAIPVLNMKTFRRKNLDKVGIETKQRSGTLYLCREAFVGFMRHLKKESYALFGERKADVPIDFGDPIPAIAPLLPKFLMAIYGRNDAVAKVDVAKRAAWFVGQKVELLAAMKKLDKETAADFKLRKLLYEHQLNELGRLYAEGQEGILGLNIDKAKSEGRFDLTLTALPGTSLKATIDSADKEASRFAGVPDGKNPLLGFRLIHPLDEMRQTHLLETFALMKERVDTRVDEDKARSDDEKKAGKEFTKQLYEFLQKTVKGGMADGLIEVRKNDGDKKNTMVGAFRAVDGESLIDVLKLLPKTRKTNSAEIGVDKQGDVQIHKVKIAFVKFKHYAEFLGADQELFIGTHKEAVWFASGENALAELKAAIVAAEKKVEHKPGEPFAKAFIKMGPWMELRAKAAGDGGFPKLRAKAREAFKEGDDSVTAEFRKDGDKIVGHMLLRVGMLRLTGKMMADFTAENLADGKKKKK